MKRILYFFAIAALLISCAKDETVSVGGNFTLTGFVGTGTKTQFGTPDEISKTIPFLWNEGDFVWSGRTKSSNAVVSEDGKTAEFTFASEPEEGSTLFYNMKASSNVAFVEKDQDISNSLGINGDFGYATVSNGVFTLNHATSYLWFDLQLFEGASLESVTVDAGNTMISGASQWNNDTRSFGSVNDGTGRITLTNVNNSSNLWTMVFYPLNFTGKKLTVIYKIKVSENYFEYHKRTLDGIELVAGTTYRIAHSINESNATSIDEYNVTRTLTFEDDDVQFSGWDLWYADYGMGRWIEKWSDLIDQPQYMGPLLYGDMMFAEYNWYDEGNTELIHYFPYNNAYCFWGGGHAISNYWGAGYANDDRDRHIATYYGQDYVDYHKGSSDADSYLGWFCVQLMVPVEPHSGSNFAVHYGYKDFFTYIENLPEWTFGDGYERVIDHMYVTNTNYTLNQLVNGVMSEQGNTFGGTWTGLNDDAWLKITAQGFESEFDEDPIREVHFYLVKGNSVVEDWAKWDLSKLGAIGKVRFNFEYSKDMGGQYGFTIPGYFAYDDVAVRSKN